MCWVGGDKESPTIPDVGTKRMLASRSGRFTPGSSLPPYPLYTRLNSPWTCLEAMEKRKISYLCHESNSRFLSCPARSLVVIPTALSRLPCEMEIVLKTGIQICLMSMNEWLVQTQRLVGNTGASSIFYVERVPENLFINLRLSH
jgi:hypothetical protein